MLKRSDFARRLPLASLLALSFAYLASCGDYLPPGDEITGGPGSVGQVNVDASVTGGATVGGGGEGGEGGESLPGTSGSGGQAGGVGGAAGGGAGGMVPSACSVCEQTKCKVSVSAGPIPTVYPDCYEDEGLALEGKRAGTKRKELCAAVVECTRRTKCIIADPPFTPGDAITPGRCLCGSVSDAKCLDDQMSTGNGACIAELEAAGESLAGAVVAERLRDQAFAIGRAINYVHLCDYTLCYAECSGGPVTGQPTGGAGGASNSGGAGGAAGSPATGGISGSGGSGAGSGGMIGSGGAAGGSPGSGGSAGAGGSPASGGSTGSGSVGTSAKCLTCEAMSCSQTEAGCSLFEGARKAACEAWVACIRTPRQKSCVEVKDGAADVQKCYCGTKSDSQCLSGKGDGVCKAEAERASELEPCTAEETSSGTCAERQATDVAVRFRDPAFPIGPGSNLMFCDFESCNPVCTAVTNDPPPGGAGGAGGTPTGGISGAGGTSTGGVSGAGGTPTGGISGAGGTSTGGVSGAGGTPTGGISGAGGTPASGGTGGTTATGVLVNPDFNLDTSGWAAESSVVLLFNAEDAEARSGSGSVDVTNTVFAVNVNSTSWAGGAQCVAVAADTTYALTAKAKVPSDRPTGSAGIDVRFFASAEGCKDTATFGDPRFTTTPNGAWKDVTVTAKTPAGARFMLVRLIAVKAFYEPSLTVRFDKIRLTKMP